MPRKLLNTKSKKVLIADVKDAPFKCHVCRKVFISEGHLERHHGRRHPSFNYSEHSRASKEKGTLNDDFQRNDQHSIKAVLNATERIEYLLANLTYGVGTVKKLSVSTSTFDGKTFVTSSHIDPDQVLPLTDSKNAYENTFSTSNIQSNNSLINEKDSMKNTTKMCIPLANSTKNEMNSDSLEDIGSYLESKDYSEDSSEESVNETNASAPVSQHELKKNVNILNEQSSDDSYRNVTINGSNISRIVIGSKEQSSLKGEGKSSKFLEQSHTCLEPEENELLKGIICSKVETIVGETPIHNCQLSPTLSESSNKEVSLRMQQETLSEAHARLKNKVISKLNYKLTKYGVDSSWQNISDKTAFYIGNLLKTEREEINKSFPDYNKLRELINHNANTRIKMSMYN